MPHLRPPWSDSPRTFQVASNYASGEAEDACYVTGSEVLEEFHEVVEALLETALVDLRDHVQTELRLQLHSTLSKYGRNQHLDAHDDIEADKHSDDLFASSDSASGRISPRRSSGKGCVDFADSVVSSEEPGRTSFASALARDPRRSSVYGKGKRASAYGGQKVDLAWQLTGSEASFMEERPSLQHISSETARSMLQRRSRKTWTMGLYGRLSGMVMSPTFEHWMGVLVLVNAFFVGLDIEDRVYGGSSFMGIPSGWLFQSLDTLFCFVFMAELGLRISVSRWDFFFDEGWHWNVFDMAIILSQAAEKVIFIFSIGMVHDRRSPVPPAVLVLRGLRTLRVLHLFHEVRMIVHSILTSAIALLWTLLLLLMVNFTFSVIFVEVIMDRKEPASAGLQHWFGSLVRTMLTLLECIISGVSWDEIILVLLDADVSPYVCALLCSYICLGLFVILNLLTGIFVDKAMRAAREENDMHVTDAITSLFLDEENHQNTYITFDEFSKKIDNEAMSEYFASIGIDVGQSRALFELIDEDQSGFVDAEEIVKGCLRLRGEAKALDVVMMLRESRMLKDTMERRFAKMDNLIFDLDTRLTQMSARNLRMPTSSSRLSSGFAGGNPLPSIPSPPPSDRTHRTSGNGVRYEQAAHLATMNLQSSKFVSGAA